MSKNILLLNKWILSKVVCNRALNLVWYCDSILLDSVFHQKKRVLLDSVIFSV